jgi:hypothetical protein
MKPLGHNGVQLQLHRENSKLFAGNRNAAGLATARDCAITWSGKISQGDAIQAGPDVQRGINEARKE